MRVFEIDETRKGCGHEMTRDVNIHNLHHSITYSSEGVVIREHKRETERVDKR